MPKDKIDNCSFLEENSENQLSPLKRNCLRIFSAVLFGLLIWGTVCITDYIMDSIRNFF